MYLYNVHMMMYRMLFTGLEKFIKVCWGTNILVSPCKTPQILKYIVLPRPRLLSEVALSLGPCALKNPVFL